MVALWAEVKRTGVTGREAHGCPCLRLPPPAQKDEWQGNNFSKASVCMYMYVCVCVCVPPAWLAYGLSVGT